VYSQLLLIIVSNCRLIGRWKKNSMHFSKLYFDSVWRRYEFLSTTSRCTECTFCVFTIWILVFFFDSYVGVVFWWVMIIDVSALVLCSSMNIISCHVISIWFCQNIMSHSFIGFGLKGKKFCINKSYMRRSLNIYIYIYTHTYL